MKTPTSLLITAILVRYVLQCFFTSELRLMPAFFVALGSLTGKSNSSSTSTSI